MVPLIMGIVNVTPDSFSDGGRFIDPDRAVARVLELGAAGADIVDIGGESTRPGADPVDALTEQDRVVPVIEAVHDEEPSLRLSIDTAKPEVAKAAVAAGATLINDISASLDDVAADLGVGWVAMHMQGRPRTMQVQPHYDDVVAEVRAALVTAAGRAAARGVEEIWIDPGIGFGKTAAHNYALLAHLDELVTTGHPVVVGTSRKRFLGETLAASDGSDDVPTSDRLEASVATATWAMAMGARMVRVHDVTETAQAAKVVAGEVAA